MARKALNCHKDWSLRLQAFLRYLRKCTYNVLQPLVGIGSITRLHVKFGQLKKIGARRWTTPEWKKRKSKPKLTRSLHTQTCTLVSPLSHEKAWICLYSAPFLKFDDNCHRSWHQRSPWKSSRHPFRHVVKILWLVCTEHWFWDFCLFVLLPLLRIYRPYFEVFNSRRSW